MDFLGPVTSYAGAGAFGYFKCQNQRPTLITFKVQIPGINVQYIPKPTCLECHSINRHVYTGIQKTCQKSGLFPYLTHNAISPLQMMFLNDLKV